MATGSEPGGCLLLALLPFPISSLDGVRATGESTSSRGRVPIKTNLGNYTERHFSGFFAEEKRGFVSFRAHLCVFANGADRTHFGGDGHHDCGAGCLRLRSVAHRYHSQSLLLFTIVFARRTDRGLCVQRECGQQTGRYRAAQVGDSSVEVFKLNLASRISLSAL